MNTTTKRDTRTERAAREYHSYRLTGGNLKVRPVDGPERQVGVVYVSHRDTIYTVLLCADEQGDLHPCGCNCMDAQRRKQYEQFPTPCKHAIAAGWWLTGEVPPLPLEGGIDLEAEGELLAKLEESERIERARRDADRLWEDHR